jgi:3-hydroxybutyryl-CoA dehydratase
MIPFSLDDFFEHVFVIDEAVYQGFIQIFKDNNPLHTNSKFAVNHGFSSKVMHGNILNGFLSYFIGECLPTKEVIIHSQEIQYKNAIYLNDELIFNAQVSGIYESVGAIEFKFTFKNNVAKVMAKGKFQIGLIK